MVFLKSLNFIPKLSDFLGLAKFIIYLERPVIIDNEYIRSQGKRVCGTGDINTLLCILNSSSYHINGIYLIYNTTYNDEYTTAPLPPDYLLILTRDETFLLIVRFCLTEGRVCSTQKYSKHVVQDISTLSWIMENALEVCGIIQLIQGIRALERLKSKSFVEIMRFKGLIFSPDYPMEDTKKFNWNLYINSYFYWRSSFEEKKRQAEFPFLKYWKESIGSRTKTITFWKSLLYMHFELACSCNTSFDILWLLFSGIVGRSICLIELYFIVAYPLKVIFVFLLIYLSAHCYRMINDFEDKVVSIPISECSPDFTSQAFFAYQEHLKKFSSFPVTILILPSLSLPCDLFHLQSFPHKINFSF
ncbi:unnamed protein product [Moneuplotes crassus]|uniref:Uncharacterized protein n=1 Tax=Euplotes crassus TaxID=5936 RepID=A0AAD1XC80_EUPCR|nr:unnamed protein product [Moneuplotes crassus]